MTGRPAGRPGIDAVTAETLRYLLTLAPAEIRPEVSALLRLDPDDGASEPVPPHGDGGYRLPVLAGLTPLLPRSAGWWMLREDQPEVNRFLLERGWLPPGLATDVLAGVPFGPGRTEPVPVLPARYGVWVPAPVAPDPVEELLARLRAAVGPRKLRSARVMAGQVRHADWQLVSEAHAAAPLPGLARWALAERIDCPAELRAAFGSHPKFEHRLRQATVTVECRELLDRAGATRVTLRMFDVGRWAFPTALAPVEDALRPLVAEHLGGRPEAWVALARLLPTHGGTVRALLTRAGRAGPGDEAELPEPPVQPEATGQPTADHVLTVLASPLHSEPVDGPLTEHRRRMAELRARGELPGGRPEQPERGGGLLGWLRRRLG
ncbi:hypothetical protein ACIRBX_18655 [Kitasatospora sp. NPDC096147]|uniref:hypothetical protein n=1 Tax=Kitasatospora sp. NPDC096147 TaxID=3364093 RepID=UPI00381E18EE